MSDLETLRSRLALQLSDASADLWPAAALDECLRLALAGYNRAAGDPLQPGRAGWGVDQHAAGRGLGPALERGGRAGSLRPGAGSVPASSARMPGWRERCWPGPNCSLSTLRPAWGKCVCGGCSHLESPHSPWEWEE